MSLRTTLLGVAFAATAAGASTAGPDFVNLDEARARHESGQVILIDIREPREHATGVVAEARLLPLSQLNQRLAEIPTDPARQVHLICSSQNRSPAVLRASQHRRLHPRSLRARRKERVGPARLADGEAGRLRRAIPSCARHESGTRIVR
jgi:rhodanese-related sulfurtransferase